MTDGHDEPRADPAHEGDDRFTVLEVFGLKLEVSNPHLADLLTRDAGEALTTDVRDLKSPGSAHEPDARIHEPGIEGMAATAAPDDEEDVAERKAIREQMAGLGESMGFVTHVDGVWESPTGVVILTRVIGDNMSFATASHLVEKIAEGRPSHTGEDSSVLFIAPDQQTADIFKVAIRQGQFHHAMRTVSRENLREMARMFPMDVLDHGQTVILLAPVADIDVGEVLSVIRSAISPGE